MSKIVISGNMKRLNVLLRGLADKKAVQKAVARSIKRTLTSVQKTAASGIRAKRMLKLTAAQAKRKVHSFDESGPAKAVSRQYGKIWFGSNPESLGRFYARRVAAGRSHAIMRQNKYGGWEGVRLFRVKVNSYGQPYLKEPKRSFLVERGRGRVIFTRVAGVSRLPIEKQFGPSMAELVNSSGLIVRIRDVARERYEKEFESNVRFYTQKALERAMKAK